MPTIGKLQYLALILTITLTSLGIIKTTLELIKMVSEWLKSKKKTHNKRPQPRKQKRR